VPVDLVEAHRTLRAARVYRRRVTQPDETGRLLERFAAEAAGAVPLTALWAHGELFARDADR
jgi:hypothetical protein